MNYKDIITFWFDELKPKNWWEKSTELDNSIKDRFLPYLEAAKAGELAHWRKTALGRLAEIIVLDQFSRNIFRDTPIAFSQDAQALTLTQEAIREGAHRELNPTLLPFLLMPIMHSESKAIHEKYSKYFDTPETKGTYDFELKHKIIIDEFGRYPHRNKILNRTSTKLETEFLTKPGSSF